MCFTKKGNKPAKVVNAKIVEVATAHEFKGVSVYELEFIGKQYEDEIKRIKEIAGQAYELAYDQAFRDIMVTVKKIIDDNVDMKKENAFLRTQLNMSVER